MRATVACAWIAIGCSGPTRPRTSEPAPEPSAIEPSATEPSATDPPVIEPSATRPDARIGECVFGELEIGADPLIYGVPHARSSSLERLGAVRLDAASLTGGRDEELFRDRQGSTLKRLERCWEHRGSEDAAAKAGGTLTVDADVGADGKLSAIVATGTDVLLPCAPDVTKKLRFDKGPTGHLSVTVRFEPPERRSAADYAWLADAAAEVEARPALATCWSDAVARDPSQGENVVVALVLDDGAVRSADAGRPWDAILRTCLADAYAGMQLTAAPSGDVHLACSVALLPPPGPWKGKAAARLALWPTRVVLDGATVARWKYEDNLDWTQEGVYPADVDAATKPHWMELAVDGAVVFDDVLRAIDWARVNGQEVRLADHDLVLGEEVGVRHVDGPSTGEPRVTAFADAIDVRLDGETPWAEAEAILRTANARYATLSTD